MLSGQRDRFDYPFVLLILIAGSLALFFKIGEIPPLYPWFDESEIAADAVDTLRGGLQLFYPNQLAGGSLAVWLEAGWMTLFGRELLGLRLLNGLVNLASALLLYLLILQLPFRVGNLKGNGPFSSPNLAFNRWLGLAAALLFAVSTWFLGLGRIATPNWSLVPLMTILAFYCFWLGLNTNRGRYFLMAGGVMGLLFYGYVPGYFVPVVPALFLILDWVINRKRVLFQLSALHLLPFLVMLVVAAPILIFFVLNPAATLQRPLQLAKTNQLSAIDAMVQGAVHMLSAFGLVPNWLLRGDFGLLAFDPLVTVLFVIGLLIALWHWREPAYLFLLVWWAVMITPALLSRSASWGFVFEVWRRGVGAQPASFILAGLTVVAAANWVSERVVRWRADSSINGKPSVVHSLVVSVVVIASAGWGYWLYFERWANSGAVSALFAEGPVQLVEWMEAEGQADTLFVFPIQPNVSPTTRPQLFTVRYLYEGQATVAFPVIDETRLDQTLVEVLDRRPAVVKLIMPDWIVIDPKGYFEYALALYGEAVSYEHLPDHTVVTYQLWPDGKVNDGPFEPIDVAFGDTLRLTGQRVQPDELAAGQTLGIALVWVMQNQQKVDYNASVALYDGQGYELAKVDKPLLSAGEYLTTRHWSPGAESKLYYALPIPPDAPPGPYTVRVVAYNAETGIQLPPVGGQTDLSFPLAEIGLTPGLVAVEPETLAIAQPLGAQFPGGLHLIGAESSALATSHPGDRLRVTLLWQARAPLSQNIGLMLALVGTDNEPVPLFKKSQPLIADYPTPAWPVGHSYRVNYEVLLPATLTTDDYLLALRLLDLETAESLAEQVLFPVPIEARAHIFETPPLANQFDVDFGEAIRLLGAEFGEEGAKLSPGQEVRLKLQWQALREISESYKIFLHLTDSVDQIVGQIDTLPRQGAAPTTGWVPGEIVEDELRLVVPSDILPGSYRMVVGLYNEKTGERLVVGQNDQVVLVEGIEIR